MKKRMYRMAAVLAAWITVSSATVALAEEIPLSAGIVHIPEQVQDGTYIGTATVGEDVEGLAFVPYNIQMEVTVSGGAIATITYSTEATDNSALCMQNAYAGINGKLVGQTVGDVSIDAVSGATYSSNAMVTAINSALTQATMKAPKIKGVQVVQKGMKVTWNRVDGAESYVLYRNGKKVKELTATSYVDKKAKINGKKYTYRVAARQQDVKSTDSVPKTGYFLEKNSIGNVLNGSKGSRSLIITWSKNKKASGYQLQWSASKNFKAAKKLNVKQKTSVIAFLNGLQANKTYYVRVRSYKKAGGKKYYGLWSSVKKGTVRAY